MTYSDRAHRGGSEYVPLDQLSCNSCPCRGEKVILPFFGKIYAFVHSKTFRKAYYFVEVSQGTQFHTLKRGKSWTLMASTGRRNNFFRFFYAGPITTKSILNWRQKKIARFKQKISSIFG